MMVGERYDFGRFRDLFAQGDDATNDARSTWCDQNIKRLVCTVTRLVLVRSCYNRNTKATCLHSDAIGVYRMICEGFDRSRSHDLFDSDAS